MSTASASTKKPVMDVAKICELARIGVSPEKTAEFQRHLEKITGFLGKLDELNLDGVEPTIYGQPSANALREDIAVPGLSKEEALANAPERIGDEFKVPKIVE